MVTKTGKIGWIISPKQEASSPAVVQVTLCPAFWEVGAGDLRLMMGQNAFDYHFFDVGRSHFEMKAGQFFLLGPERLVRNQDTLDRILFEVPRREKVRFFVIVFGGIQQADDN